MNLHTRFLKEIAGLGLPVAAPPSTIVTETDLAPLPEPAQRFLRFAGVLGRPRDWSFVVSFRGRFRMGQDEPWRACEVWQYDSRAVVARIFCMSLHIGVVPLIDRDTYLQGHGHLLVRLADAVPVVDATGPEIDLGEQSTYLNDLVLIAPSMLLAPDVTWQAIDTTSFGLTLSDYGRTVSARVFVDPRGLPVNFETTDRFREDPTDRKKWVRALWSTPMEGSCSVDGRQLPARGQARWHLTDDAFTYADFEIVPGSLMFNVGPGH